MTSTPAEILRALDLAAARRPDWTVRLVDEPTWPDEQISADRMTIWVNLHKLETTVEAAVFHALAHVELHTLTGLQPFGIEQERQADQLGELMLGQFNADDFCPF